MVPTARFSRFCPRRPAGTGKTYTLLGNPSAVDSQEGLVPRTILEIFRYISSLDRDSVTLKASYSALTVGKDCQLFDLLAPGSNPQSLKDVRTAVIHNSLTQRSLTTPEDVYEVLKVGRVALSLAESQSSVPDMGGSRTKASVGPVQGGRTGLGNKLSAPRKKSRAFLSMAFV